MRAGRGEDGELFVGLAGSTCREMGVLEIGHLATGTHLTLLDCILDMVKVVQKKESIE